jgi:hypothetical protein
VGGVGGTAPAPGRGRTAWLRARPACGGGAASADVFGNGGEGYVLPTVGAPPRMAGLPGLVAQPSATTRAAEMTEGLFPAPPPPHQEVGAGGQGEAGPGE